MVKEKLLKCIQQAVSDTQQEGCIPLAILPDINIERPKDLRHGDYATGLPLKLARISGISPLEIAKRIINHLSLPEEIDNAVAAPPGFINFTLSDKWLCQQVSVILNADKSYGDTNLGSNTYIQFEFVSVNPTGPLHIGHGRGAVLGSTLANIFTSAGYKVEREYYLNDTGNQINIFGTSLYARYQQCLGKEADMPINGYFGNYMTALARKIISEHGEKFLQLSQQEAITQLTKIGMEKIVQGIKQDLQLLKVDFDVWYSEKDLYHNGQYQQAMEKLQQRGYITKRENATWFESSVLGEDKDNVLVRSDGSPTYFASDIAYHHSKFLQRKFDRVIDIWGADHQGHVPRMKAVLKALSIDPERLSVILCQLVTLRRGKEVIKVSKRSGDVITLREVIDEVGTDACRFFFLSRSADSQMDFDLELAKKQSVDNPVYYIQYAHARIASILRLANEKHIAYDEGDLSLLSTKPELSLIRCLTFLPETIENVVDTLQPQYLTYYSQELATLFHSFYKQCRVVSQDEALTKARLKLVRASQITLAKTLRLMGMTVPETM
ncbi:MAG: arginine--tRNA ligase [Dehalococcoidia bacterium]|nr:arginine--tRNA ligase [Dehalococcoidia bacterium]